MLSEDAIKELEKQQYRLVGDNKHSSVKICGWTKNLIRGKGGCYKLKFYGIMSNQCLQMSTSMTCANRCMFCWRGYKAPVSKEWEWPVDDPLQIIDQAIEAHHDLLQGFGGSKTINKKMYDDSKQVKHVALSLTGEPIIYPRINEAITEFHRRGISTFMVTNAQYADHIRDLAPVTQLYVSIDAPNKSLLKKVDVPLFSDYWERMLQSLDNLKQRKERTTIRITLIKEVNMIEPEHYADLIMKGDPDFIEVKGYMFVGASRQKLSLHNMPYHEDVMEFTKELMKYLPGYEIADEHKPSRVVLLAKKKYFDPDKQSWETWIDFDAFFHLWNDQKEIVAEDYGVRWTNHSTTPATMKEQDESVEEISLD